ncbi:DUF2269 domain-containing protein [Streptomyces pratensis]|uniref:DUF2269 domain-containing protein n=1 Tax=Streptomyces pratensis TaxID=1169025 RepID=UPI0037B107CC
MAVSVSWLGLTVGLPALTLTAHLTRYGSGLHPRHEVFGGRLVVPVALLSLLSCLPLAPGTPWVLARHRWVWTTFWLTLITAWLSVSSLRPGIDEAVALGATDIDLVIASAVAPVTYLFITAISVLKLWAPTRRCRRLR